MARRLAIALLAAGIGCGPDLSRVDGSLSVRLLGAEPDVSSVTLVIDHEGTSSELTATVAEEIQVESVPAGESAVRARANGLRSNQLTVRVFEGELTRVGLTLTNDGGADPDSDGLANREDNCPFVANDSQADADRDGLGDACDNCLANNDPDQTDLDGDGYGNLCDPDLDGDSVLNILDGCPYDASGALDADADAVCDSSDNCVGVANADQGDCDCDLAGDVCDPDLDGDGITNATDVCPYAYDPEQVDSNQDNVGDVCQDDPLACRVPPEHCPKDGG